MEMGDAPAVDRPLVPVALPAFGNERLPIGQRRREHEIVDEPGGVACHDDADVAGVSVPLRILLLRLCASV